jgi:hypothetical protein
MFNTEGKIVAKIRNNKSILIPKNYSYMERSADRSTLTLHDDYDKEILYVEYLNKSAVSLRGILTGPNGTTIGLFDKGVVAPQRIVISNYCSMNAPQGMRVSKDGMTF